MFKDIEVGAFAEMPDGTPIVLRCNDGSAIPLYWELLARSESRGWAQGWTVWTDRRGYNSGEQYAVVPDDDTPEGLRKARYAYLAVPDALKPDWLSADWFAPYADIHFPQLVDQDDIAMVSFFENERKRDADRRTVMRVGRYIRRYAKELPDEDVERVAAASDVKLKGSRVKITQDPDEIEQVYRNGPASCMSGGAGKFDTGGIHPTRVYAGPDLGIAYLGELEDPSARCVVWPERELYGTCYGDVSRLRLMLERMGFEEGSMDGARVRLIETDCGDVVMPYVDDASGGRIDRSEGVVILGSGHSVETSNTNGLGSEDTRVTCEHCDERVDSDDTGTVETSRYGCETWCDSCISDGATYVDGGVCAYVPDDCVTEVHLATGSTENRANWDLDDFVQIEAGSCEGEWWEADATGANADGEIVHIDDLPEPGEAPAPSLPPLASQAELEAAGQIPLPIAEPVREGMYRLIRSEGGLPDAECVVTGHNIETYRYRGTWDECETQRTSLQTLYPSIRYTIQAVETFALAA